MAVKRRLLAGFFLFMLACTAISRIYDSMTVPKVLTETTKRKAVETVIEGNGTVKVKDKHLYPVAAGLRLGYVAVVQGSEVKEGELLFRYDLDSVRESREKLSAELEQLDLAIEKERLAQETELEISRTELAQRELEMAQKELEEEQVALEEKQDEYEREQMRLAQEYEEDMARLNDDLWQQQDREWEKAKQELETAKDSRNREVRAAQRRIDALVEELDQIAGESGDVPDEQEGAERKESEQERSEGSKRENSEQEGRNSGEETGNTGKDSERYREAEEELQVQRENLETLKAGWKERIDSAQTQLDLLEDQEERIHAGRTQEQESAKESYEEKLRQEEEKMEEAREGQKAFEKAVENAAWELAVAQRQDEAALYAKERQQRISSLTIRGLELDKREKQRQLSRLDELDRKGGEVTAQEDGIVADMELVAGKTASGEELLSLAVGGNQFEAVFLKEEQKLAKGDRINISIPGTPRKEAAVIGQMNLMGEKEGVFWADLEGTALAPGSVTAYSCTKQSDIFAKVIPLEGLRKDMNGTFCLVAREHAAILGEEFRAERVNVEIVYRGSREAAVEGAIFEEDAVIVGENKGISEGERVRVVKSFGDG